MKAWKVGKAPGCQSTDRRRATRQWSNFIFRNLAMDLNVKLLQSPNGKNQLIIVTGGLIDTEGLERIFRHVAETIQRLFDCQVLIDFEDAHLRLEPADIDGIVNELGPDLRRGNSKIALVSSAETDAPEQLRVLSDSLRSQDLSVAMFDNAQAAVTWLVNTT